MKKLIVLVALTAILTGFAAAGGLDFQLGAGYHSAYVGTIPDSFGSAASTVSAMPLGVGGYVGVGYGFGQRKMINLGVEFAPSWDFALYPLGVSNFAFQGRAYLKFKPAGLVTATAFGGFQGNVAGDFSNPASFVGYPVLGARLTVLFMYAEYAAVLPELGSGDLGIAKHEIGVGFAFFR